MTLLYILENLLYPPAITILLMVLGLILWRKHKVLAPWFISIGLGLLYIASLPATTSVISELLEYHAPLDTGDCSYRTEAKAIVVLGYTRDETGQEFGGPVSSGGQIERLRYAAYLYKCHPLPVLLVGGDALDTGIKQADLMRRTLEHYFATPVTALDGRSKHTWNNATFARELVLEEGIDHILLVTHAWHMPRAVMLFENKGLKVTPAPTSYTSFNKTATGFAALIPSAGYLGHNQRLFHEIAGILLHRLKHLLD